MFNRISGLTMGLLAAPLFLGFSAEAQAQSVFCPSSVTASPATLSQTAGTCTNRDNPAVDPSRSTGAFSGAALASQALSDLAQSATQETTQTAADAINNRRTQEQERCGDGFTRVNGVCERIRPARTAAPVAPSRRPVAAPVSARRAPARVARRAAPVREPVIVAEPAPIPVSFGPRYGVWSQVFGDYERRSASGSTNIVCCTGTGAAIPNIVNIDVRSRSRSGGFLLGADMTSYGLFRPGDGFTAGLLAGYVDSTLKLTTTAISTTPNVANGSSNLEAHLRGPSVGIFTNYFAGAFSADLMFKADFLSLNESFNDILGFSANTNLGIFTAPFSGRASTNLVASTLKANANYRFYLTQAAWFEPTAGVQFTTLSYDGNAARLGLDDGHALRLQGGARIGTTFDLSPTSRLTASVTGLAYSNVIISGGFIAGGAFGTSELLARADEGKLRGEGILTLNLEQANGWSGFVQGSLRGGDGLWGGGGKAGIRYQW